LDGFVACNGVAANSLGRGTATPRAHEDATEAEGKATRIDRIRCEQDDYLRAIELSSKFLMSGIYALLKRE
jgi:hypothetical protein